MLKGNTPAQDRINKEYFETLCGYQCTEIEIAGFFKVDEDTLLTWCKNTYDGMTFSDIYKIYSAPGKISLRRYMFEQAKKNPTMAIWLSKQHLGMTDKVEVESIEFTKVDELLNEIKKDAER